MKPKKRTGRRTIISPEMEAEILKTLEIGETIDNACACVGIHRDTFFEHQKRSPDFADRAMRARAKARRSAVERVRSAGEKDWRAEAWFLERRYHEDYGIRERVRVDQNSNARVTIVYERVDTEKNRKKKKGGQ